MWPKVLAETSRRLVFAGENVAGAEDLVKPGADADARRGHQGQPDDRSRAAAFAPDQRRKRIIVGDCPSGMRSRSLRQRLGARLRLPQPDEFLLGVPVPAHRTNLVPWRYLNVDAQFE